MNHIYFKGLEKLLNEGCYIKVFNCALRYPVVRVERKNKDTKEEELVAYEEGGNIISALNTASAKIVKEVHGNDPIMCENTQIDKVVDQGYTLHFYKLSNGQVLGTICTGGKGRYVPVKSIIEDDIKSAFETLDAALKEYQLEGSHDFYHFVESQEKPVREYKASIRK